MDWVDMYPKSEHHLLIYSLTQITYVQNTPVEAARASNQEEGTFHLKMTTTLTFQFQLQLPTQPCLRTRCTLTKQGQRFLTKISTTTTNTNTTENLIRKFVQFSPKSVLLSTLTHLLSSSPTTSNLSSLALPLYTRITQAPWFTYNPTIVADLIALLHKLGRYSEAQTLISQAISNLNNQERDLVLFYSKLLDSHSKRASRTGFDSAFSHLNHLLHTSSSFYVKRRAYESMVSGLCAMDKPREAENLVRDLSRTDGDDDNNGNGQFRFQPSAFEFKGILYGYGRLGMFHDLLRVVDQMEKNGFVIDTVCYNMVLSTYGKHGEHVEMVSWLRRMRDSGVPFSIRTYNSVSNSCPTIMRKVVDMDMNELVLSIEELNGSLEGGEAMVVKELVSCSVILEEVMVWDSKEVKLDLHGFHLGSAYLVMLLWLEEMQKRLLNGEIPAEITVVCGFGKHSNVRGESPVKVLVKEMLMKMKSPLRIDRKNIGCFVAKGKAVKNWLCELRNP
ncbi:pentatricopeptide repeat-containing protein At2g17033 [Cicer arietinum]|uniref:Pentatricopeptide repeat-containing protein At2g17033 n=1 Tax=Cicer arietinum TaxID=3827 RepID=A0A1S3E3B1_CICAR|nr:pentatricopeptide repeat-containing protein At2g17033 [Cicer arietinum]